MLVIICHVAVTVVVIGVVVESFLQPLGPMVVGMSARMV